MSEQPIRTVWDPTPPAPAWTQEPPAQPGWYWVRWMREAPKKSPWVASWRLSDFDGENDPAWWERDQSVFGIEHWPIPIQPPQEQPDGM